MKFKKYLQNCLKAYSLKYVYKLEPNGRTKNDLNVTICHVV